MIKMQFLAYQEKNIFFVDIVVFGQKKKKKLVIALIVMYIMKDMIIIVLGLENVLQKKL